MTQARRPADWCQGGGAADRGGGDDAPGAPGAPTIGGDFAQGETWIREALVAFRGISGVSAWRIANAESILGACLAGLGRYVEAEALLLASYPIVREGTTAGAAYTSELLARIVTLYESWDKPEKAEEYRALWIAAGGGS